MKHIRIAIFTFLATILLCACKKESENHAPLTLSTETLIDGVNKTISFEIRSGSGQYTVKSENTSLATASLEGNKVTLNTLAVGQTHIIVTDTQTQQEKKVSLTITEFHIGQATLYVGTNTTVTTEITGSGDYSVTNSQEAVATATLSGQILSVKGISVGEATLTIKDQKLNAEAYVNVIVLNTQPVGQELQLITVEGGTFQMGTPAGTDKSDGDENPVHSVTLSTFKISKYEITNAQFAEFLNKNGQGNKKEGAITWYNLEGKDAYIRKVGDAFAVLPGKEDYPVNNVTWYAAVAYAQWKGGRLPTEAEWEYAARGGNQSQNYKFIGSNDGNEVGWNRNNISTAGPQKVGTKKPNELGIYDMAGNLNEYCSDWYGAYSAEAQTNPQGVSEANAIPHRTLGIRKICRGGSYQGSVNFFFAWDRNQVTRDSQTASSCGFRIVIP